MKTQRGLTFLEFVVLLVVLGVLLVISAGLFSQISTQQKLLDDKAEIVNLTGQLSILRQSTSICSCNISRLPVFDSSTLDKYKSSVAALQIWDPSCSNATSTLIATKSSGLTPHRSAQAESIDFLNLTKVTDSIYKLDLEIPLFGQAGEHKKLTLSNILVYTRPDPASDITSLRRKITACVPLTGAGEHILISDQKPSGVPGGSCEAYRWNKRVFTKILIDDHGVVQNPIDKYGFFTDPVAPSDLNLRQGTYACEITAPTHYGTSSSQARLINADTGEVLLNGTSESTGTSRPSTMRSVVRGRFILRASASVRLESYVNPPRAAELNTQANCLGEKTQSGAPEVYSTFDCWRLP